jgi:hypothetical protein
MKILVACEESQAVTIELRKLGHEAYSCDIEPCSGGHPEWHLQEDVIPLLKKHWDMIIAFPPCTHLAVSGAAWFEEKRKDGRQREAIEFFMQILNSDCEKIAVENPVNIISGKYIGKHFKDLQDKYGFPIKPSQSIQPYEYGHMEQKKTCLWLKGLPLLQSTNNVYEEMMELPKNKRERLHYLPPSEDRAKIRSKTFHGVAEAMAEQWAGVNQQK